jgi:chromosome segregation ATPase
MDTKREMLEEQLEDFEVQHRGLHAYIKELKEMVAKHGTDSSQFADDLMEAEHNVKYFHDEIARVKQELANCGEPRKEGEAECGLSPTARQGITSAAIAAVSFAAGALVGSKFKSRGGRGDARDDGE